MTALEWAKELRKPDIILSGEESWEQLREIAALLESGAKDAARLADAVRERDEARGERNRWANLGGVSTGKVCTLDPKDHHAIYGPYFGDNPDGPFACFACELHFYRRELAARDLLLEQEKRDWLANNVEVDRKQAIVATALDNCRKELASAYREWRPIADHPNVWTTRSKSEVDNSKATYPWLKFETRLVGKWEPES